MWAFIGGVWKYCSVSHTGAGDLETWHCTGTLTTMQEGHRVAMFTLTLGRVFIPSIGGYVIPGGSGPPSYFLLKGWNLIGYTPVPDPTANSTVGQYLNTVNGSYDVHKVWVFDLGKVLGTAMMGLGEQCLRQPLPCGFT